MEGRGGSKTTTTVAADGSTAQLMDTEEIRKEFSCQPNQHGGVPMARILARADVLNEIIIDGLIGPISKGEKEMAVSYLWSTSFNLSTFGGQSFHAGFPLFTGQAVPTT